MWKTFAEIGEIAANSQTSFVAEYRRTKDTCKLDELVHDGTSTSVHNDQSTRSSLPNADGSSSQGAQIQPGPSRSNQHLLQSRPSQTTPSLASSELNVRYTLTHSRLTAFPIMLLDFAGNSRLASISKLNSVMVIRFRSYLFKI